MALVHTRIPEVDSGVSQWALFLHGILGRGSNWQSFARRLIELTTEAGATGWGALLPDLRMHGDSQALPGPHTVAAAVEDVHALIGGLDRPVEAVIGHSFGGKVAVSLLRDPPPTLRQVWVLDAAPSAKGGRTQDDLIRRVLDALAELPAQVQSRSEFIERLRAARVEDSIAKWLAKNLVRNSAGLGFALDLNAIEALLADHDAVDVWPLVESPPAGVRLGYVLGGRSRSVPSADRERLEALARAGVLELHVLPDASHWVHADDPVGLLNILSARLGRP